MLFYLVRYWVHTCTFWDKFILRWQITLNQSLSITMKYFSKEMSESRKAIFMFVGIAHYALCIMHPSLFIPNTSCCKFKSKIHMDNALSFIAQCSNSTKPIISKQWANQQTIKSLHNTWSNMINNTTQNQGQNMIFKNGGKSSTSSGRMDNWWIMEMST